MLNKQKGNMYAFVTHTWNPIKGKCSHDCEYCYMKVWKQKPIHLVEKELKDNLGQDNFIFVGSSTDMFAKDVPNTWIYSVLTRCRNYPKNRYLFQSKNPMRFQHFLKYFPSNVVLGTTIESNRFYPNVSDAPHIDERRRWMILIRKRTMVTIEPILDFDVEQFTQIIREINPEWVNMGADSKGHKLPEPSTQKVLELIEELNKFTQVKVKDNLKRLVGSANTKNAK